MRFGTKCDGISTQSIILVSSQVLVRPAAAPTPAPDRASPHLAPCTPWGASVPLRCSIATPISTSIGISVAITAIAVASIGVAIASTVAAISPAVTPPAAAATTETSSAVVLRRHLLDVDLVAVDGGSALLDHLLGSLLPVEGDEAEVLWFIILALVNRSHHLCHWSVLKGKIFLKYLKQMNISVNFCETYIVEKNTRL